MHALWVDRGKIDLHVGRAMWIEDAMRLAPMREAPLTFEIVRTLTGIDTAPSDRADRLLAATTATPDLELVTADERLLGGRG